jgi:hypothetical protein
MTLVSRRLMSAYVVCCALTAVQLLALSFSPSKTAANCESVRNWAEPYRTTRPTLAHLASFTRAQRVAIFNAISPEARADLWREHLEAFARRQQLSPGQRSLIVEAVLELSPAAYHNAPLARQASMDLLRRVDAAFTAPEQRRAWTDLGYGLSRHASERGEASCECRVGSFAECAGCVPTICYVSMGCGWEWRDACNGTCP